MRARQPSIAESLMDARTLLDGRYRLDVLVRRSATTTIHVATHRNGSTAWLKLPLSPAHAELIALEARIANAIGSPLVVRDDGTTPEGMPYLVLDPPEAESLAALRASGRTGARLPVARVMTAGDALVRVVMSVHAMGFVTAGLEDEDILVFPSGDVALLDLHALVPAHPAGVAADMTRLRGALAGLVADVLDASPTAPIRAALDRALAAAHPDLAALQAAWRAASPEPVGLPARARSGSLADIPSVPPFAAQDTPLSVSVHDEPARERDTEGSMIGYLRSGGVPSVPPEAQAPQDRAVMYDPLSKMAEVPRLVQAASRTPEPEPRSGSALLVGILVAVPLLALLAGASWWRLSTSGVTRGEASEIAATATAPPTSIALPTSLPTSTAPPTSTSLPTSTSTSPPTSTDPSPKASPPPAVLASAAASGAPVAPPADEIELTSLLRSESAPPDRDVFIDGKSVGKTPLRASVPCGRHDLQTVAGGAKHAVELPCGGERVIVYDAKGHWTLQ
jgi:eukaryotic-like serine/threonine-protein kinase